MKKKLTLTIEESLSRRGKVQAKREGASVSQWVEEMLRDKTAEHEEWSPVPGSWTEKMLGAVSLKESDLPADYKKWKEREMQKKYGG